MEEAAPVWPEPDNAPEQQPSPPQLRRLLVCNIGRIGDTILRNSILDSACRTYAAVDYVCGTHNAECVLNDPRLNRVIVYDKKPGGFAAVLKAAWGSRYDGFIDLKNHCSATSLMLAGLFRSRVKTGCNGGRLRPFHRDTQDLETGQVHLVQTMQRIGQRAGLTPGVYKPSLKVSSESAAWFQEKHGGGRPFIFLNLSATHAARHWPVRNWVRYVRGCGLAGERFLVNGVPADFGRVRELCRALPSLTAFLPRHFMDVAAAVAAARLVLTVDTGVVHVCSALDRPVVALYCTGSAGTVFKPLSSWHLMIRPQTGASVADIDPAQAVAETRRHGLV
jgi:ADP-heptose:LPS heptosyltransferase